MLKKLGSLALVLVMVLGMAACSGKDFAGNYTYTLEDYVKLGDYKGLAYQATPVTVTEEDLQAEIQNRLMAAKDSADNKETLTAGSVENGDIANIDYEGKLEGVAFEGGTAEAFDLTIGSGQFIPGFEEGLIGSEVGDTVDVPVTFPADYGTATLAGKDVMFTVKVNSITRGTMPVYDLNFVKATSAFTTLEEYEAGVKQDLLMQKEDAALSAMQNTLWNQVMETAEIIGYPEGEVEARKQENIDFYTDYAEKSGIDINQFIESYFGMSEADFQEYMDGYAKTIVEQEMVMYSIAKAENISISDKEYKDLVTLAIKEQGFESDKAFEAQSGLDFETYAGKENLQKTFLLEKVIKFIVDEAVVTK